MVSLGVKPSEIPVGTTFGLLTVSGARILHRTPSGSSSYKYPCTCRCGGSTTSFGSALTNGQSTSCGCLRTINRRKATTTHGMSHTRLYNIWSCMISRCENANNTAFAYYGGRGITICPEWRSFVGFHKWAVAHDYDEHLTLDRIDNDGDYSPENCRWGTQREQMLNTRANNHITAFGETKPATLWARDSRCPLDNPQTITKRVSRGWDAEKAITAPSARPCRS